VLTIFPPDQLEAAVAALTADEAPEVDRLLVEYVKTSTMAAWEIEHGMFVFGVSTPRAVLAEILKYHLRDGVADAISCPTLVLDAEGDMFFKGQPEALYKHLTSAPTGWPLRASTTGSTRHSAQTDCPAPPRDALRPASSPDGRSTFSA
jgi:hypothetical protein